MTSKKRGLGSGVQNLGLSELLSSINTPPPQTDAEMAREYQRLAVDHLQPGQFQPRRAMQDGPLQDLAASIRAQGVLQPLVVREVAQGYEIIAGERRWRAAQLAGLTDVPVVVKSISDEAAMAVGLIENMQREDLNVVDQAHGLKRLHEEFGLTHQAVGEVVGKSRTTVTNLLRLLQLAPPVLTLLEEGAIEMGHARALLALPASAQLEVAEKIASKQLSVRETETLVKQLLSPTNGRSAPTNSTPAQLQSWCQSLSKQLSTNVQVRHTGKGNGRLMVHYRDLEELKRIVAQLQQQVEAV